MNIFGYAASWDAEKSTVGRALAKRYCAEFIDMDTYIEEKRADEHPTDFCPVWRASFSEMETACITAFRTHSPAVIASGGGAFVSGSNATLASQSGKIIFLDIPFETCYQRIQYSDRPIVKRSTKEELQNLFELRQKHYTENATICFREI